MSANSGMSGEEIEGTVVAEKAANDTNKDEEKADLVSQNECVIFCFFFLSNYLKIESHVKQ